METAITMQVGDRNLAVAPGFLPPIGTRIHVHKHLFDGGTYPTVEVLEHEWRLEEPQPDENGDDVLPLFTVLIKTRIVK